LGNFFTRTEIRFFRKEEAKNAWDWLEEKPEHKQRLKPVQPYQHILLATDFSAYSEQAAHRAIELPRQYTAQLETLHIIEGMVFYTEHYEPVIADMPLRDDTLKVQAQDSMQ